MLVESENVSLIGAFYSQLGAIGGANVLVEYENVFLIGGNWGQM